jgi:hypothetical protein
MVPIWFAEMLARETRMLDGMTFANGFFIRTPSPERLFQKGLCLAGTLSHPLSSTRFKTRLAVTLVSDAARDHCFTCFASPLHRSWLRM